MVVKRAIGMDVLARVQEKARARKLDMERLKSGDTSVADLAAENGLYWCLPLERFRIAAIGGVSFDKIR